MTAQINPAPQANPWQAHSRSAVVRSGIERRRFPKARPCVSILNFAALAALFMSPTILWAQSGSANDPGMNSGGYNIHQTIEAGYRANFVNGNKDTYDTFENLGPGLRLFDYSFEMRSLDHKGLLFDSLTFSNFGYGGDPNDVTRLPF